MSTAQPQSPPSSTASAAPVNGLRLRRHLARLLEAHDRLALIATERLSHGLDDGNEYFALMIGIEDEVSALYPAVHAELFPTWISGVPGASHEPGGFASECGICRATPPVRLPEAA